MRGVVSLLGLAVLGGGVLVLVVVYNVTRMSVRDRLDAIEVVRSTGGTPRTLLAIFAARAGLLTAVGIALGYALGVIVTSAVVNAAIAVGLRISLAPTVSPAVLRIVVPGLAVLLVAESARAVSRSTGDDHAAVSTPTSVRSGVETGMDRQRTDATTANGRGHDRPPLAGGRSGGDDLTIFVLVVLLVGSLVGVLAPLATTSSGTTAEPGAPYPMASRIDAGYADLLRRQGVTASPEIIVPSSERPTVSRARSELALVRGGVGREPRRGTHRRTIRCRHWQ